jgi:hypothetical protein
VTVSDPVNAQIGQWQRTALLVGIVGLLVACGGFVLDRGQFMRSYLFAYLFWFGMGIGCLGILMMHHTVGGKWGMVIRRFLEAGARTLPYMSILLIPVLLNMPILYSWARPEAAHDPIILAKAAYLNVPGVVGRAVLYFAILALYSYLLSKWSAEQDRTGDPKFSAKMQAISAPGLVVFTFVATFAFIDWIMSLEPHWFSTIYGAMFLVGQMLESFAFVIALLIVLSVKPPLKEFVTKQHLHDLGNMMFTFMILWAYTAFSQYIIIWSGNLPDEIPWYLRRLHGGWGWVALLLVAFHFFAPLFLLLMRSVKRNPSSLLKVCLMMIVIRIVDVYWIVEPAFYNQQLKIHWMDFVTPVAIGGLWLAAFFWQLNSRPLVPLKDPQLVGAPRETVAF